MGKELRNLMVAGKRRRTGSIRNQHDLHDFEVAICSHGLPG